MAIQRSEAEELLGDTIGPRHEPLVVSKPEWAIGQGNAASPPVKVNGKPLDIGQQSKTQRTLGSYTEVRHRWSLAMKKAISRDDMERVAKRLVAEAEEGDMVAMKLLLDRLWPAEQKIDVSAQTISLSAMAGPIADINHVGAEDRRALLEIAHRSIPSLAERVAAAVTDAAVASAVVVSDMEDEDE